MKKILSLILFAALFAGGCSKTPSPGTSGTTTTLQNVNLDDVEFVSALVSFTTCDDLLSYLQEQAIARVGPYGLDSGGWYGPIGILRMEEGMMMAEPEMALAADSDASMTAGVDYSGTNVQEVGIDEPDIIKTDGSRILVLSGNEFHFIDVSGPTPELTDSLSFEGHWPREILFSGDRAFVLASADAETIHYEDAADESADIAPGYGGYWRNLSSIIEIDLSNPYELSIVNTLTLDGSYVSARVVNGVARIVISTPMNQLPFVYPQNEAGEENAKKFNQEVISGTTLEDWLPNYFFESSNGTSSQGLIADCSNIHYPTEFSGFSTLSVVTVDLDSSLETPDATGVLADGQTVYASNSNLYVATTSYLDPILFENDESLWEDASDNYATSIHQFDVSDLDATTYMASGSVDGHLLNQFAMSEHEGHLRVATTLGGPWGFRDDSESKVSVLVRNGSDLEIVGEVGDMGRGERIFSVRFVGDTGYIVTFRQTDPFYTVDLSDPTNPVVRGELKITGYSGYLHPLNDDLVLGIGQDATDTGQTTGAKVTLFDVSNLDQPVALDSWITSGGSSSVEWDHRSFLWWPANELAVLPFNDWYSNFSGAVALRISNGTITEVGRIDHQDESSDPVDPVCDLIDEEVLAEFLGSVDGRTVMLCEADTYSEMDGHWCEYYPSDLAAVWAEEEGFGSDIVPENKMITICYPEEYVWMPQIERTLVIGEQLWSYSYDRLQLNDLDSLERLQVVKL